MTFPIEPFDRLIRAFEQDQTVTRYQTFDDVFGYCVNSANPVGHLVLYLCGYRDPERQQLSDYTCTALQLANFWQDVTVDLEKDRIYLPLDLFGKHGYTEEELFALKFDPQFASIMRDAVSVAEELFRKGSAADRKGGPPPGSRSRTIQPRRHEDPPERLKSRSTMSSIGGRTSRRRNACVSCFNVCRDCSRSDVSFRSSDSYRYCRTVARARAKNFYYSFLLLEKPQRDAMCAIYAFMRHCDDLSDDPAITDKPKLQQTIALWRVQLDRALHGNVEGDPIWPAFTTRFSDMRFRTAFFTK